ncbi:MAG: malectin domain-containing carbohydrate-binding protein [candidate division KSB1 bacterium]|nr:malectin domain-containing carbohydrate-binding protein [candidate division KSB1 bacterium]
MTRTIIGRQVISYSFALLLIAANITFAEGRIKLSINSGWRFHRGNIAEAEKMNDPSLGRELVNLPHSWNVADAFDDEDGYYQGIGWYHKNLFLSDAYLGKRIYLFFEGANQVAEVYVNGKFVGQHIGGYTAFRFDATDFIRCGADNRVLVKVDNSASNEIPPISADFTFYGGIYRDVFLEITEPIHFDMANYGSPGVFIQPTIHGKTALINVRGQLKNDSRMAERVIVKTIIHDASGKEIGGWVSQPIRTRPGQAIPFEHEFTLQNIRLWSPDQPYLYRATVKILDQKHHRLLDNIELPLGFRTFRFDPERGFLLNDVPLRLLGANRHQDFDGMANALPDELHHQDMKLLKAMGANFIRIAHYPQDPAVLHACDQLGLIAWEEIPLVNLIGASEAFARNSETALIEMIRQHHHHPSVFFWGLMNEILLRAFESGNEVFPGIIEKTTTLTRKLNQIAHAEDPSRMTVLAHHGDYRRYQQAGLLDVTDICGWNLYFGWYSEGFEKFLDFVDAFHRDYPAVPIIISEYGAGSDERVHSHAPMRFDFSTEWQQHFHEQYLSMIQSRPFIAGAVIWNLVDFGSEGRKDTKPHVNQKGMLYRNRRPKDVYYFYQANWNRQQPVVKIASSDWKLRSGVPQPGKKWVTEPIKIYSNCQIVELLHDGVSLGKQAPDSIKRCYFDVPFHEGRNHLLCLGTFQDGRPISDHLDITYQFMPADLSESSVNELCVNAGAPFYFVEERENLIWLPDQPYQLGGWGYIGGSDLQMWPGKRWGTDQEIFASEREPLYQTQRDSMIAYRFDVPNGDYEVELHFAEISGLGKNPSTFNQEREFDILINNVPVISDLNLASQYGKNRAVSFKVQVPIDNGKGIEIAFQSKKGSPVINGIRLNKRF